jgi:hypothetical protein
MLGHSFLGGQELKQMIDDPDVKLTQNNGTIPVDVKGCNDGS